MAQYAGSRLSLGGFSLVTSIEAALEVPAGTVPGYSAVNKFGQTVNADSTIATDVWDRSAQPIWLAPTAPRIHAIVSSDVNDDGSPVGTGARTIRVSGLPDWDTAETSEVVTLNGTTSVNTVNSYVIIHRMSVLTSGASGPNVGVISATAADDATVTAQIAAGAGQTLMAIYGIPSTQTAYLTQFYCTVERDSPVGATITGRLKYTMDVEASPTIFITKHTWAQSNGDGEQVHPYNPYNKFVGPSILKIQVVSSADNTLVDAGFDIVLVNN